MKKLEIAAFLHDVLEAELAPRGFEWKKHRSPLGKSWVRREEQRGVTDSITPVVTVFGPRSAVAYFQVDFAVDALQALETDWTTDPIFKALSPLGGTNPVTLGAPTLKDCPGGSTLGFASPADFDGNVEQALPILHANLTWLERFSDLPRLRAFLETATDEELMLASILPRLREVRLLQIYVLGGAMSEARAVATRLSDREDHGDLVLVGLRARATVALARME